MTVLCKVEEEGEGKTKVVKRGEDSHHQTLFFGTILRIFMIYFHEPLL
jgi:hypothetical protein